MNSPTARRLAAAFAATGMAVMPLAGCTAKPPAPQTGSLPAFCATPKGSSDREICDRFRSVYPSATIPTSTAPKTSAKPNTASPQAQQPDKKGGGIPTWVWILGGAGVAFVGYRFFMGQQGGGGTAPAHAAYGAAPVPQQPTFDYDDYDDYDDEPGLVTPAPPAPPVAPAAPPSGGNSGSNGDLWGA